jgi:hypothetical protein
VDKNFNGNGASAAAWIKQFALRETTDFLQAPVLCDHIHFLKGGEEASGNSRRCLV